MPSKGEEKMLKETVITILIISLIVIGNIITQNNTNQTVEEINKQLDSLRDNIISENVVQEEVSKQMEEIENHWNEKYEKLAYYIEHDELEKVGTEFAKLKADITTEEYATAVENLDNCQFILQHIRDKSALKIVNIF